MDVQRCKVRSNLPRAWVWAALTDVSTFSRWSGFDRCVSGASRLSPDEEYSCAMSWGPHQLDARLSVLVAEAPEHLLLETVAPLATVTEDIRLTSQGLRQTTVSYAMSATSSTFGPSAGAWIKERLSAVQGGLVEVFEDDGAFWNAAGD